MPSLSTDYIFMSYSRRDDAVMRRIVAFLRGQGITVWVDNEELIPGTPVWEKEIEKAIQGALAVVVVLSPDSNDSVWVRREISLADQYEKRVFPLLVRGDEKTSISIRLNGRQYVDIRSNEDAGLNYVSATLLRYLEELSEREQNAKKEASRLAAQKIKNEKRLAKQKADEERIALEKVNAERKAKEEADHLFAQKADQERTALEKVNAERKAKEDSDRLAAQKVDQDRIANVKAEADGKAKEDAYRLAVQKAELESKEKLARENIEREARDKLAREKMEQDSREKAKVESKIEKPVVIKPEPKKQSGMKLPLRGIGLIAFFVLALIVWKLSSLPASLNAIPNSTATQTPLVPGTPTLVPATSTTAIIPTPALGIGSTEISPKDGMTLLYVPAGEFLMGSIDGDTLASSDEKPQHAVTLDAYWIDQTDVTNAMYAKCVLAGKCSSPIDTTHYRNSNYANRPVVYVSWNDALAYCSWADRRLPTEAEWEKAARGPNANIYPWGNNAPNKDLLNYNKNVGDITEVGKYHNGKSFYGAYDMAGDVWQWVNDWYGDAYYQSSPSSNPLGPDTGQYRVLRGGSWNDSDSDVRSAYRLRSDPSYTYYVFGFRCARSEANATNQAPTVTVAPIATQFPALGFGSTMTDKDGMTLLYVPAGEFTMGSDLNPDEQPIHKVTLDAYWIDQTEVTNAQYAKCVADNGACKEPINKNSFAHSSYYGNSEFDHYPVLFVDWSMAKAYCEWAGRSLPTEAEWEKAARGTDARIYPWGNDVPNKDFLNYNSNVGDTTEVGKYPNGKSVYGAYDMAGNVWEWVSDWYSDTYYKSSPLLNPIGPDSGQFRVLRGGSWSVDNISVRSVSRGWFDPTNISFIIGFRCSRSP